jgi:hypothetical protein
MAEYALRDLRKPVGVAEYRLTEALPRRLRKRVRVQVPCPSLMIETMEGYPPSWPAGILRLASGQTGFGDVFQTPLPAAGTHRQNLNAVNLARPVFGQARLSDITPETSEHYVDVAERLKSERRFRSKLGSGTWGD